MDRAQPVLKKSLEKKRIEHDYKIHQEKLKKAKSSIDCHNTANWTHLKTKSKKLQKDEGIIFLAFIYNIFLNSFHLFFSAFFFFLYPYFFF